MEEVYSLSYLVVKEAKAENHVIFQLLIPIRERLLVGILVDKAIYLSVVIIAITY